MSQLHLHLAVTICLVFKLALACDDGDGIHCISGQFDCPQEIFRDGVTSNGCQQHCCRVNGGQLATAQHIADGATVLINPGQPGPGYCSWCPGTGNENFKCCDQRRLGFSAPLSRCNRYRPSRCVSPGTTN